MPKVTLPSGRNIFVRVNHVNVKKEHGSAYTVLGKDETAPEGVQVLKATQIRIFDGDEKEAFAEQISICSAADNYSRREGRHRAAKKILKIVHDGRVITDAQKKQVISREDRGKLMQVLCPEFFTSPEAKLRRIYESLKQRFDPELKVVTPKPSKSSESRKKKPELKVSKG